MLFVSAALDARHATVSGGGGEGGGGEGANGEGVKGPGGGGVVGESMMACVGHGAPAAACSAPVNPSGM